MTNFDKLNESEANELVKKLFPNLHSLCVDFEVGVNTITCFLKESVPHVHTVSVRQNFITIGVGMIVIPTTIIIDVEPYGLERDYGIDEFNNFIDFIFDKKQPYIWQTKHNFYLK